jgi:CheY-like chemotaxis protein
VGGDSACDPESVPLRCLIVDDNARFGDAARALLERQGIAVVAIATSSDEAARQVRELAPDVALIDIGLGEESGFDLAEHLHADPDRPCPSIILISTRDEREFADLIEASPAVGFLAKSEMSADTIYDKLADGSRSGVDD